MKPQPRVIRGLEDVPRGGAEGVPSGLSKDPGGTESVSRGYQGVRKGVKPGGKREGGKGCREGVERVSKGSKRGFIRRVSKGSRRRCRRGIPKKVQKGVLKRVRRGSEGIGLNSQ